MKTITATIASFSILFCVGCTTVYGPNGPQSVMSPAGAAVVQGLVSAGLGAATGSLMSKSPSWANGMLSAGVGSVGSQVVNAFIPQASGSSQQTYQNNYSGYNNYPNYRPNTGYGNSYPQQSYSYPNYQQQGYQQPQAYYPNNANYRGALYQQDANGQFVRVN
jgi:hypothetical protein